MPRVSVGWIGRIGLALCWALVASLWAVGPEASAQSVGRGASPGRAAYRPESQWNNGPFYTVPHVDPYGPRGPSSVDLPHTDPDAPPYTTEPRGRYGAYDSEGASLRPYDQGFSPFSGYGSWYLRANNFTPTDRDLTGATARYFKSSPIPPRPRYMAPAVAGAYYAPPKVASSRNATPARPKAAQPRLEVPKAPTTAPKPRGTVVYRFGSSSRN
jgi:hypothetical protein